MSKFTLGGVCAVLLATIAPASVAMASTGPALEISAAVAKVAQQAKSGKAEDLLFARRGRGADDGPNHDLNDDRGGDRNRGGRGGRGGRGRGGHDDGPNHT